MRRRDFIPLLGGVAAWPLAARGQELGRIGRIGVLSPFAESNPEARGNMAAFQQTLEKYRGPTSILDRRKCDFYPGPAVLSASARADLWTRGGVEQWIL